MLTLKDNDGNALPEDVQKRVNDFIDSLKNVRWFQPEQALSKDVVEKQARFALKCFGVKASIEYRQLKTEKDWDAAWDAAWVAARDAAWDAARGAARDAAWDAAWVAAELLILEKIKDKYPHGASIQLFKLWEMGLYPVGILKDTGTFVIYVPPCRVEFPFS